MTRAGLAKQANQQSTGAVFALGPMSECGLRPCFPINLKSPPRYARVKRLKSGVEAYYWAIPTWAKAEGCTLPPEPLGCDRLAAYVQAETLNLRFDRWKEARRNTQGAVIPTKIPRSNRRPAPLKDFSELARLNAAC